MEFVLQWKTVRMWQMLMAWDPLFNSSIRSPSHTTTKQNIGCMTPTIGNMIWLHFLQSGGQNGDKTDNLQFFWWLQRQMQQIQAHGQGKEMVKPQLVLHWALAPKMLTNNLDKNETTVTGLDALELLDHWKDWKWVKLTKRPLSTGAWDNSIGTSSTTQDVYQKTHCATFDCLNQCRTHYCSCNKKVTMCQTCYNFNFGSKNSMLQA